MKILANDGISAEGQKALESAGYTVITEKVNQEDIATYTNTENIEIILVRSATTVRAALIDACPGLKLIGRGGVGMDNIDVDYARSKGLTVINTPASSSQSVAELVMGQLFSLSRMLYDSYRHMPTSNGNFEVLKKKYAKGIELRGKTLGIIGFGRIGQSLASYALGAGMKVIAIGSDNDAHQIELPEIQGLGKLKTTVLSSTDLMGKLPEMDFISLHVPKQSNGNAVLGEAQFAVMKKGVRIANASRGGVVDEDALLNALNSGQVAAIALDVFENEPHPRQDLLEHANIASTPHIGAATLEAQDRIGLELAELIIAQFGNKV
jgi:D-3-phosphoglycerate dehydrogenase / 2-oxoglutarate reductase